MKRKLKNGGISRLLHGVFKSGTEDQVARWDSRKDKVISTALRLMRNDKTLKLEVRSQWFTSPPKERAEAPQS